MTLYNGKGKQTGVQTWKITGVKKQGEGFVATINSTLMDEKGKELTKSTGTYECSGGALRSDIRMSLPQEQMQAYQVSEAQMEPVYIEYPYNLSEGQTLKDAAFEMNVKQASGLSSKVSYKALNRKVEGKEKVESPAGTWDAYKITYDGTFRMQMSGVGIPMNMKVTEWFVPGFGIVKTESYNKSGKLMASTLITSIKK